MEKSRFIELVQKRELGEISLLEIKELNDAIANTPLYAFIQEKMQMFSGEQPAFNKRADHEIERELNRLKKKIARGASPGRVALLRGLTVAASVLIVVGLGIMALIYGTRERAATVALNVIATEKGSKTTIVLPDGSKVWVNSDTKLTYDRFFGERTRSVYLTGEAYFDVAKDKGHPFIVHTETADIKAVGTSFNVRAYAGERLSETTLLSGVVEVSVKKGHVEKIRLKPMEKLLIKNRPFARAQDKTDAEPELSIIKIAAADTAREGLPETSWITNRLVFRQLPLQDIARDLERYYNAEVVIEDSALLGRKLSGNFKEESLEAVLETFKLAAGINYKINGKKVKLYH